MRLELDDLQINNYKIYQDRDAFCFGIDSVLLANFFLRNINTINENIKVCDLCSGNLIIPLIIYAKRKNYNLSDINISAFEIDKGQTDISRKSIEYNKINDIDLDKNIIVYNDDIKNIYLNKDKYKNLYNTFDSITVNPPYIKVDAGVSHDNTKINIAKHEISVNIDDIIKVSSLILKSNKKLFMVHKSERLVEINNILEKYGFKIKLLKFIHPSINKSSNLVLIMAVKGGKDGIKVSNPLIVFDENNNYTKDIKNIYGDNKEYN